MTLSVLKRNKSVQPWDQDKINSAIFSAMESVLSAINVEDDRVNEVGLLVRMYFESKQRNEDTDVFDVEDIQDIVVATLQSQDFHEVATAYTTYRTQQSILRPSTIGLSEALADYVTYSKYSRSDASTGYLKSWPKICDSLEEMYERQIQRRIDSSIKPLEVDKVKTGMKAAMNLIRSKVILPSMRSLQFAGLPIESNNARMYNCSFSPVNRLDFFKETFFLLLSGCGVGYSVQDTHIAYLPQLTKSRKVKTLTIEDSIEGWAEALDFLLNGYVDGSPEMGEEAFYPEFNYIYVRKEGEELKTSGGKAPGHIPLKTALEAIRVILDDIALTEWTPFKAHRITCLLAEAVLAGGIRRSSLICLFDEDDYEIYNCKRSKTWFTDFPELRLANNSVAIPFDKVGSFNWKKLIDTAMNYGEPGFFIQQHEYHGTNPCGEIGLDAAATLHGYKNQTKFINQGTRGLGFTFCNLTSINLSKITSMVEFLEACEAATVIGTIQASFDQVGKDEDLAVANPLTDATREIMQEDALLGVSLNAIFDSKYDLSEEELQEGALHCLRFNEVYAEALGINKASRLTTVKPEGTSSLALGGCSAGVHPHHSKSYFRRVKASPQESCAQLMKAFNPHMVTEVSDTEWLITFPIVAPEGAVTKDDVSALDLLDKIGKIYKNWVVPGTRSLEEDPYQTYNSALITHNVSSTVTIKEDEKDEVIDWLEGNYVNYQEQIDFVGEERNMMMPAIAFMRHYGDKDYPNAPFEAVTSAADVVKFNELISNYKPVPYDQIHKAHTEFGSACEGPSCEIEPPF